MASKIPNYALYGDSARADWMDMVHFERIRDRSSLYQFDIAPHVHDALVQLLYVRSGRGTVSIDGVDWPVCPETVIVVPAQHVHGFKFTPDVDGYVITAAQRPLEALCAVGAPELTEQVRHPLVLSVAEHAEAADGLAKMFEVVERIARRHRPGGVAAGSALLLAMFVEVSHLARAQRALAQTGARTPSRKTELVNRFRALVDAHFREHWPVDRYASGLGVTTGHLSRLCRDVLGMSSLDVITARVLHEAKRELAYSILSVKQIAHLLGFAEEAYFGRFFRKHAGMTATEFRQKAGLRLAAGAAAPAAPDETP